MDAGEGRERARRAAAEAGTWSAKLLNVLFSCALSPLPRRWRAGLEARTGLDGDEVALPSSFLQLGLGFGMGVVGFFAFLRAQADASDALGIGLMMMNPIQPFLFILLTPQGFVSFLVTMGGFVRLMSLALNREPCADPVLALAEWIRSRLASRARREARELAKGGDTPDVLVVGSSHSGFDLRLLTRAEHDWNDTVTILVAEKPYRLIRSAETRDDEGHLRMQYDLRRITGAEAFRGLRRYQPAQSPVVRADEPPAV